ncbi:GNAT family N-acetyltransferase [Paenibacillus sp. OSY-SE]|uniref:GNAT family N-acetyltransferase n=1 Tax=Paenibacillus sp. OSY-SE TaxID=1196323 RepID=UPI0002F0AD14|nr:GNAT family N-acetyltransferase [Paenibacillus sp. OSY-SE]
MKTAFRKFDKSCYDKVCDFLIDISQDDRRHINWNWARWEWMFFHPDFDRDIMNKIGLWFSNDELVGMATYDHYFGEAFFVNKQGFEELEKELLEYAIATFSNENGLGIAVNDTDTHTLELLRSRNFVKNEQAENILELTLDNVSLDYKISEGITIKNLDVKKDLYKHHNMLWKAFDHEGQAPVDETTMNKQQVMLSATNLNPFLHIVAENEDGEYVAYCGLWYCQKTDYAYVEPVCTIPEYRQKGLGKAVVLEALKRSHSLGAKKAYVISDSPFYKSLGFQQHSHYTFYWHDI